MHRLGAIRGVGSSLAARCKETGWKPVLPASGKTGKMPVLPIMAKRIEFDAPDGFVLPEGKGAGDDVEVLATVRAKSDGRLCLVELDGHRMKGFRDEDEDEKTYVQASTEAMEQGEGGY